MMAWLALCGLTACARPWPADTLVIAVQAPAKTWDPRLAVDAASTRLWRMVFAGLTSLQPDGTTTLDLAAAITPVDTGGEGTTVYDVHLRHDRVFHDGTAVTAADVVCTFRSIMDPALGSPVAGEFARRFAAVEAPSRFVARFVLRAPLATFRSDLILGIVPATTCAAPGMVLRLPIGAGPFRIVVQSGSEASTAAGLDSVMLERVDAAAAPMQPRRIVLRAIPDEGSRALSVLGGGADVALGLSPPVLRAAGEHRRGHIVATPGLAWSYLAFNLRHPVLADRRVRRALDVALDRDALIATVLGGRARAAATMQAPGHWAVDSALQPRATDRSLARAGLDAAGLGVDATGWRLSLRLLTSSTAQRRAEAEAIALQLAPLGIRVEVRSLEVATLLAAVRAGHFDLFLLGLPEPGEPDYMAWMFHSDNAAQRRFEPAAISPYARLDRALPRPWPAAADLARWPRCIAATARARARALVALGRTGAGLSTHHGAGNRTGYSDPLVDCLLELGQTASTQAERAQLYREVGRRLHRDVPVLSLWHEDVVALVGDRFDVPPPAADGRYASWARARYRGRH